MVVGKLRGWWWWRVRHIRIVRLVCSQSKQLNVMLYMRWFGFINWLNWWVHSQHHVQIHLVAGPDLCKCLWIFHCICFWKGNYWFVKKKMPSFLFQKGVLNNWRNVCKALNLIKKNLTKICEHFVYIKNLEILIVFNQSIINSFVIFVLVMQFNKFYSIDFYKKFNEFRELWSSNSMNFTNYDHEVQWISQIMIMIFFDLWYNVLPHFQKINSVFTLFQTHWRTLFETKPIWRSLNNFISNIYSNFCSIRQWFSFAFAYS